MIHAGIVWTSLLASGSPCFLAPAVVSYVLVFGFFVYLIFFETLPISWVDKHVHGGLCIMFDDVLRG